MNSVIKVLITNNDGIHARTAAMLLGVINKYNVEAYLKYRNETVNLKHLIEVIALSVCYGAEVEIILTGKEVSECKLELTNVIGNNIGDIL